MTSTNSVQENNLISFLQVPYGETGFLINRDEIITTLLTYTKKKIQTNSRFIKSVIMHANEAVPVLDLDLYLTECFKIKEKTLKKVILLIDLQKMNKQNKKYLGILYEKNGMTHKMSTNFIGLTIKNNIQLNKIVIEELKLLPIQITLPLVRNGILGIKFHQKSAHYVISLEDIIFKKLLRKGALKHECVSC